MIQIQSTNTSSDYQLFQVIDNKMHPPVGRQKSASPKPQVWRICKFQVMKIPALRYSHLNPKYFQAANKPSPPPSLPTSLIPGRTPALPSLPSGKTKRFWMPKKSFILFQVWALDLSPLAPPPANLTDLLVKAVPAGRWDPLHLLTDLLIPQEPCLDQFLSLKVSVIRMTFGMSVVHTFWSISQSKVLIRANNRCKTEF